MQENNNNTESQREESTPQRPAVVAMIMGGIMVAIYMGMAFLLTFTTLFVGKMPEWVRYMMGAVFFVYGIFRAYRVYKSHR